MKKQPKHSPKSSSAVHMVSEASSECELRWAATTLILAKIGCGPETLCCQVRQQKRETGQRLPLGMPGRLLSPG